MSHIVFISILLLKPTGLVLSFYLQLARNQNNEQEEVQTTNKTSKQYLTIVSAKKENNKLEGVTQDKLCKMLEMIPCRS
jgi:hypothetical protein